MLGGVPSESRAPTLACLLARGKFIGRFAMRRSALFYCFAVCTLTMTAWAQSAETRTAQRLDAIHDNPAAVRAFVLRMPKGGDLHMHLSGAVYAETFLQNAADDNLCADPVKLVLLPNIGTTKSNPAKPVCAEGTIPAAEAFTNQKLYDALVDSFSMRSFQPTPGVSGHDQFFATFGRFNGISKTHLPEWVDEVATRAASQNEQYLEIMSTPDFAEAAALARKLNLPGNRTDYAAMRDELLKAGLAANLARDREEFDMVERRRREIEHCGTPQATAACTVEVRFLFQVLRAFPPSTVFAQTVLAFELASIDPRVVGLNYVQPEDSYSSMSQYSEQMRMLRALRPLYPKVHLSLHAGELAPGLVPPAGLRFHIREAVEVAGAERIGHGVDMASETRSAQLLREMHDRNIMLELNITSNDTILGVRGNYSPLSLYRAAGVPFAISTDDEGVSRIDLTNEYMRGVIDQHLTYADLKASARASLEHSFLPGDTLNATPNRYTTLRGGCTLSATLRPSPTCETFLKSSERATQQYDLERRFAAFEADTISR